MKRKRSKTDELDTLLRTIYDVILKLRELRTKYMMEAWAARHRGRNPANGARKNNQLKKKAEFAVLSARSANRTLVHFLKTRNQIMERAFENAEL